MPKEIYIIVGCIIGIYLLIIIVIAFVVRSLLKDIKRKEQSINIVMAQKYDLLIALGNLMVEKGIELSKNISETLNLKNHEKLKVYNTMERLSIKTLLTKTVDTMFYIAETNKIGEDIKYLVLKKSIQDIDVHHRKSIASYNSQVVAYNYWIKTWLFRPVSLILRLKEKEIMY